MNVQSSAVGAAFKAAFVLLFVWLAYQSLSARDFSAPSPVMGTAPILK